MKEHEKKKCEHAQCYPRNKRALEFKGRFMHVLGFSGRCSVFLLVEHLFLLPVAVGLRVNRNLSEMGKSEHGGSEQKLESHQCRDTESRTLMHLRVGRPTRHENI